MPLSTYQIQLLALGIAISIIIGGVVVMVQLHKVTTTGRSSTWTSRTNLYSAPIVALPSLLALMSNGFSRPRDIPTSQSAVRHAAGQENPLAIRVAIMNGACSRQYALNVARRLRYHFNRVRIGRYIAEIATIKSSRETSIASTPLTN